MSKQDRAQLVAAQTEIVNAATKSLEAIIRALEERLEYTLQRLEKVKSERDEARECLAELQRRNKYTFGE